MMIPQKVADRLNEQVNHEYFAFWTYTAMALALESMDLKAYAKWFSMQASEEKEHAEKISGYLLEQGAKVTLKSLKDPQTEYGSVQEIVEKALDHEKTVTKQVHEILALSRSETDPATENFIGWKIAEQVEEVASIEYLLTLTKTASSQRDLFMLEGRVGKLIAARQ